MKKTSRPSFDQVVDFDNMYQAFLLARKEKTNHPEVMNFENNLLLNLAELRS